MTEQWRPVPGWSAYEVSDFGRVRRVLRATGRGGGGFTGLRQPYAGEFGHLWLCMRQNGRERVVAVHRMVLEAFVGPPPSPAHQGAHSDGDPANNRVANLRWATHAENQADRVLHGTSNRGERQHMARLRQSDIPAIRARLNDGEQQHEVARAFGVARTTIAALASGRSWAWVS